MKDQRGVATSSDNARSIEAFERALLSFNTYLGDPVATIDQALEADPDFVMGHALRGWIHVSMWERSVVGEVENAVARLRALDGRSNDRERQHARALGLWASGDWDGARSALDRLSAETPRDLVALQIGHLADFYHGDRDNLRGRIARALPAWTRSDPGYGFLLGMLGFGLEECGAYADAEQSARHALDLDPTDSWAHHAVAHVLEMQARQDEGIAFAEGRTPHWAQPDNAFRFHNWWHTALFHLDQGRTERVLDIYDAGVRSDATGIQLMLLDAASLLWRLHLQGLNVGDRWEELGAWYAGDSEDGFYAFNDVHAITVFVATGRTVECAERLAAMEAAAEGRGANAAMARSVGLPVGRALQAFGQERYGDAVDHLMPVRYHAHAFGGSHAQRDFIHRTLIEAAIRAGRQPLATALSNERTFLKPDCPFSWKLAERAGNSAARPVGA
jgi:hypothetical protein